MKWNAPSLTEHGSVEELTAVQDIPGEEPSGGYSDRTCEKLKDLNPEMAAAAGCS
ncbi:lasso RiPP family leader peptide-containing protein [Salinibacter ruber]|uniref:lasso RiPP family leader peptide-containing protein n=1 Tax=Salinibacter ruber TaxID=146919 RepID=UPI003C6DF901